MKRKSILFFTLVIASCLLNLAACSSDNNPHPEITLNSECKNVVFHTGLETQQNFRFHSSVAWKINQLNTQWIDITPLHGPAGDVELTINLKEPSTDEVRHTTAYITAGIARESFSISHFPESIELVALKIKSPKEKIHITEEIQLELEKTPVNTEDFINWESTDTSIASVDEDGLVVGKKPGKVTISAYSGDIKSQCLIEVIENFKTKGDGTTYTFEKLSTIEASGVTKEENSFVINYSFELSENDVLKIENNDVIKLKDKQQIKIEGFADFTPSEKATLTAYDDFSNPKLLYITGDNSKATLENMTFINVPIKLFAANKTQITNCSFKDIKSNTSAITVGSTQPTLIENCYFSNNYSSAISNNPRELSPIIFKNNQLLKNSTKARNRPQINIGPGGDGPVEIMNNTVVGPAENTTCGCIAVSNLLNIGGANKVVIQGNTVKDARYGISITGLMDVVIKDNQILDNHYEADPMLGGSGISLLDSSGQQNALITGNTISGNLWGITNIGNTKNNTGGPNLNLGNLTARENYNPGNNKFKNNGNNNILYDLYNNTPKTVYAQGNTWNVKKQVKENIETVIFHKHDDSKLGEVIFMPAGN